MNFIFIPKGRLGNAIFRYMGCAILCIKYNGQYSNNLNNGIYLDDKSFVHIINNHLELKNNNYILCDYYQHDAVYKDNKRELIDFINSNNHIITTDGINAGDGNREHFSIKDIINTPLEFNKIYDLVIHIRLGDKVDINHTITLENILNLIDGMENQDVTSISIVCDKCNTEYEKKCVNMVNQSLTKKFKKKIIFESNDILTDFYIMSNCKILVCSVSTLSWCAAFFSKTIDKCYMPKHYSNITNDYCDCYYPIDNTELYDI